MSDGFMNLLYGVNDSMKIAEEMFFKGYIDEALDLMADAVNTLQNINGVNYRYISESFGKAKEIYAKFNLDKKAEEMFMEQYKYRKMDLKQIREEK